MSEYTIIEELGKGAQGHTYRATNAIGVEFALKKVLDGGEVMREANFLAKVGEHENVVRVYEVTREVHNDLGQPYMVMDYVDGETLGAYVEMQGCLDPGLWWALLVPILNGVHHIHANGHFHRDLKPENIVLRQKKQRAPQSHNNRLWPRDETRCQPDVGWRHSRLSST